MSGVSPDQEMTDMLQYQRAYQAAAQIVNVNDGMMNTLINTMFHTELVRSEKCHAEFSDGHCTIQL